jgi:predicted RNase H-like HicB family nuclease
MLQYIGLIHKDPGSDYGVSFPDFPGLITVGKDLDHARAMAEEALAFHIEGLVEDGEAIPEASSLEAIMADPENRDGVAILVAVNTDIQKTVRVNITLPADVLALIDKFAESHGYTRSGFLAQAAKRVIEDEEQAA